MTNSPNEQVTTSKVLSAQALRSSPFATWNLQFSRQGHHIHPVSDGLPQKWLQGGLVIQASGNRKGDVCSVSRKQRAM